MVRSCLTGSAGDYEGESGLIRVRNALGRVVLAATVPVLETGRHKIQFDRHSPGIYVVELALPSGSYSQRLFVAN